MPTTRLLGKQDLADGTGLHGPLGGVVIGGQVAVLAVADEHSPTGSVGPNVRFPK